MIILHTFHTDSTYGSELCNPSSALNTHTKCNTMSKVKYDASGRFF